MSLSPRLIALQGVGFTPIAMAIQGFYDTPAASTPGGGRARPLPHTWNVFYPVPHRRPRKRRQDDLLFLGQ